MGEKRQKKEVKKPKSKENKNADKLPPHLKQRPK